jgi:hypothetical protein
VYVRFPFYLTSPSTFTCNLAKPKRILTYLATQLSYIIGPASRVYCFFLRTCATRISLRWKSSVLLKCYPSSHRWIMRWPGCAIDAKSWLSHAQCASCITWSGPILYQQLFRKLGCKLLCAARVATDLSSPSSARLECSFKLKR